jgi:hypothetical protein
MEVPPGGLLVVAGTRICTCSTLQMPYVEESKFKSLFKFSGCEVEYRSHDVRASTLKISLIQVPTVFVGARAGVVDSGTMIQAGRSRVRFLMRSLDFSIDLILPAALRPWGRLSL